GAPRDTLDRSGRLGSWGQAAGLLDTGGAAALRERAGAHPRAAATALRRAATVREAIFAIFSAIAAGRDAPSEAVETLSASLPEAFAGPRIERKGSGFAVRFRHDEDDLAGAVIPALARGAIDLLTSPAKDRVREGQSTAC